MLVPSTAILAAVTGTPISSTTTPLAVTNNGATELALDELSDAIALDMLDELGSTFNELELSADELGILEELEISFDEIDELETTLLELSASDELLNAASLLARLLETSLEALLETLPKTLLDKKLDELATGSDFLLPPPQAVSPTTTKITA